MYIQQLITDPKHRMKAEPNTRMQTLYVFWVRVSVCPVYLQCLSLYLRYIFLQFVLQSDPIIKMKTVQSSAYSCTSPLGHVKTWQFGQELQNRSSQKKGILVKVNSGCPTYSFQKTNIQDINILSYFNLLSKTLSGKKFICILSIYVYVYIYILPYFYMFQWIGT